MKKAIHRTAITRDLAAASAIALLCVAGAASAANRGTIHFVGAISAPPFDVAQADMQAGLAPSSAASTTADANATTVRFTARAAGGPSAHVSILAVKPGASGDSNSSPDAASASQLVTRFTDTQGHTLAPDAQGGYAVGAAGGTLSIKAQGSPQAQRGGLVTVTTAYD